MAFEFTESFTLQFPDLSGLASNFFESNTNDVGLIIEIAAIHERTNS